MNAVEGHCWNDEAMQRMRVDIGKPWSSLSEHVQTIHEANYVRIENTFDGVVGILCNATLGHNSIDRALTSIQTIVLPFHRTQ